MESQIQTQQHQTTEKISLPTEPLVHRCPSIAAIAALDAICATTKIAIICDHPSIKELIDMVEDDETVPRHLFIAHNMVNNIDILRSTIDIYIENLELHYARILNTTLPF